MQLLPVQEPRLRAVCRVREARLLVLEDLELRLLGRERVVDGLAELSLDAAQVRLGHDALGHLLQVPGGDPRVLRRGVRVGLHQRVQLRRVHVLGQRLVLPGSAQLLVGRHRGLEQHPLGVHVAIRPVQRVHRRRQLGDLLLCVREVVAVLVGDERLGLVDDLLLVLLELVAEPLLGLARQVTARADVHLSVGVRHEVREPSRAVRIGVGDRDMHEFGVRPRRDRQHLRELRGAAVLDGEVGEPHLHVRLDHLLSHRTALDEADLGLCERALLRLPVVVDHVVDTELLPGAGRDLDDSRRPVLLGREQAPDERDYHDHADKRGDDLALDLEHRPDLARGQGGRAHLWGGFDVAVFGAHWELHTSKAWGPPAVTAAMLATVPTATTPRAQRRAVPEIVGYRGHRSDTGDRSWHR